jgi:hypothetical protein
MDAIVVGIDVSKDRLDVAVRPSGKSFAVSRDASGLDDLINRLKPLLPQVIALEATGGYEIVVAASLAAAALPVVVVNPAQIRAFALRWVSVPRPIHWTLASLPTSSKQLNQLCGRCAMLTLKIWPTCSHGAVRSST